MLWILTLVFTPVAGMGALYTVSAVVLGGVFMGLAVQLRRTLDPALAMRVFGWSITYITLLFGAMALDRLIA
jgi:protoheme IX farnesyltransferase